VSGCETLRTESSSAIEQRRELQVAVAMRTRDWRPARRVLVDEVRDHGVAELSLEVDDVMGETVRGRHATRIVQIVERAATAELLAASQLP
jgi:hypothetical protein